MGKIIASAKQSAASKILQSPPDCNNLAKALENLIVQLDLMRRNEIYQNIFAFMSLNHGLVYNGPTFGVQLEVARQELAKYKKNQESAS